MKRVNVVNCLASFLRRSLSSFSSTLLLAMLCFVPALQAQSGFVYVSNRTVTGNTISAFSVDGGGVVTSLGSPVPTGGVGANILCAAVDRITISPAGNHLFITNSGDQTISSFLINPTTGGLTAAPGSPFASGLTLDSCAGISLAATPNGNFLMASANGQIKTFAVAANGALTAGSTVSLLPTPMVGMKISGDGRFLASANPSSVSVFTISAVDGSLTAVSGSPFAKGGTGNLGGVEFTCDGSLLYAGEGGATSSITDAWSVGASGALTPVLGSPFSATGSDSNIVFLTPDNTLLFQSNQGSNNLNMFTVNADGSLSSVGVFGGTGNTHTPAGLSSDSSGLFLYTADDLFGLAVFNILPTVVPTLVADNAIVSAGQIQGVAAYPPRSCSRTDFAITQTAVPNPVNAGSNITYTITITNNGPATASVAVNDLLPTSVSFVSCAVSANGTCDKGAGKNRTITFASLASGQSGTVTLTATALATLLNQDVISNTSQASNSSAVDSNPANSTATTAVTVSAPPSATVFITSPSTGSYDGTANLTTTLHRTLNGSPVVGRTITFSINGLAVGTAVTDASGIASLPNVSLFQNGAPITAGTYVGGIGVSFAGDAVFAASTAASTLTVNKATLTVTAQNATRLYGDPNPTFTFVITGFLNGETTAVVTGTPNCTSSANVNTAVGTSPITCAIGTLAATNYNFVFVGATLSITPAPLVLQGTDVSRAYGDPNPTITGTVVGLKSSDKANATFSTTAVSTSPVGQYPITGVLVPVGGFNASNYTVTSAGTVTVTPAPLTAAANSVSRAYGDPNPAITGAITGLKNGDAITATFSAAADALSTPGTYPITPTFSDPGNKLSNYTVNATGTLTITAAALTVTADNAARLYGDANPAFTGTLTGLKNGDAITATFTSTATPASSVGTASITAVLADPGNRLVNYTVVSNNGTLTITPAPLTVSAANASRLYGDANPAFTGTITGLKNGDAITASFASTADPTSAVGTFPITATLVDPTGKLPNYSVTQTGGTLTVTPAPLSVTATSTSRLYGDANPALTGTISGLKNADPITATFASTATPASPVGPFPITATVNDPAAKLGNYTVTVTNGTLTVGPAPLVVSGTNATRLYGDPNPTFAGTITGLKNADNITATFASAALVTSAVGSYPIVPTLADPTNKLGNYSVTSNNGTLSVTPAPLSLSAADASRVYGDPNPVFTGSLTGLRNGDAITASFTTTATPASNVGTFAILPSLVDPTGKAGNYSVTATNGTLTITQAPLSVVAGNATRVYGDPNPTFAGTITGLKNNDNITAVYTGVDPTSPVGAHPITPSLVDPTGKLPNYSVSSINGTLTITPAPLTVSANNATRLYGDANPAFTGTITGIKNADNITATFATTAVITSSIGSFPITPALADPGLKLTNYTVTSTNGTLSVTPAPLTVSGTTASRLYGDPNPAFTGTITGIKNADNITATFASTAVVTSPVGSFAIVPTLADPTAKLGNYSVTSNNGTLTINPASLTVTAADATRIYGDPNPAFSATVAGTKNGDVVTASATSAATAASNVGSYPVVPSAVGAPTVLSNYTVSAVNGSLTVTQAPLSVAAGNATKIYGDPNPAFTGTITGLKNNDNITATFAGVDAASPVGTFPVTPSLVDPTGKLPNYSVTTTNGTLTITPAPLSVSAANATRAYGDPNPTFTGTLTGIKNADNITATFSTSATLTSNVGAFLIVPALADPNLKLGNYTVTSTNGTLTVTAAPLTATGVNATRLYGDANPLLAATISGLKNGDPITASATSTATVLSSVGSFPVIPALSDPTNKLANYAVSLVNGALSITPAPLTVTGNNGTRVYGDANPAFTGTITGLKNADAIVATFSTTATVTSNVGTFPITGSLSPANLLANYSVTQNAGALTITQSPLTVVAGNASRLYGDANPAFVGTITGLKNGDNITASVSGADPTSAVGSYALVPALVDPTGKLPNYSVTSTNGTLTITAAPLAVTAANFSRAYGDPNPSFTGTLVGLKNADAITATFSTVANLTSPIGAFAITPALADPTTKLGNYSVTTTNGTLTVNPAVLTLTGTNATRLYGDANPAFTGTVTGVKNGENITATFASTATPASVVGSYPIVPTPVDPTNKLGNYTVTSVNGALTVSPAPLNVTSADASRAYGDPNPAFTGSVTGLKNGDVITGTFSTTATLTSVVGTYPITATLSDPGTRLGNYTVVSANGTLTITAVPLSVSAANATRTYGDPNPAFTGTIVGLRNGDNITATFSSAGPTSAIGTYPIVPSLVDPTAKLGNYTVTANNGTLTVTVASITVTAANTSRPYGSNNPALTGALVGVKNADPITAVFTTAADPTSPVGTYPIVASLLDPSSKLTNYSVTAVNATLSVVQATPAVTVAAQVGTANTVLTATVANAGAILPTGTVQFFDGANAIGQPALLAPPSPGAAPQASVTVTLATGTHSISAKYAGDSTYTSANAAAVNVIISAGAVFAFDGTGGNTSATVSAGQNATYKLSLAPQGFSGTIALSCSGAPAGTTCAVSPNSVDVTATSGSVPVTVTVSNTQNARLHVPGFGNAFVFAGVFAGLLVGFRRKRTQFLLVLLAGLLVTGMTACGGGGGNNGGTPPRNPTNATLTLTGTSGSQSASINLSLTITH